MQYWWKGALPGALILGIVAGACQDAPLSPRAPATRVTSAPSASVRTFSGASSDSLVDLVLSRWARLGHPEYRRQVEAWRQRNLGTTRVAALRDAPDPRTTRRSALLTDGSEVVKDPPQISAHREGLHFGSTLNGSTVPSVLEGEMTFVGDVGKISVGTFGITSTTGSFYSVNGDLANGPGQLTCVDVTYNCTSKRLAGSLPLPNTPICDASGNGNLLYSAVNVQTTSLSLAPLATFNTGGGTEQVASLSAQLSATAPSCAAPPPQPSDPGGTWADPAPDPYAPPPPVSTAPTVSPDTPKVTYCYSSLDPVLLYVVVICSAN
ncbi:MAG TPA: hypothetical protein VFR41_05990 [Acidimicrobiia bacterium]|nr:hypothetical protein [Acidimicrobiia bacterium]